MHCWYFGLGLAPSTGLGLYIGRQFHQGFLHLIRRGQQESRICQSYLISAEFIILKTFLHNASVFYHFLNIILKYDV